MFETVRQTPSWLSLIEYLEEVEETRDDGLDTDKKEEAKEEAETTEDSAEKRAQWRKARLESLEEDAIQAQIVIEKMSELSTSTTTGRIL